MKCLILAAGRGSRLRKVGEPKPLVKLLGLTLIERSILILNRCGINEFYVVVGYKGGQIREFLKGFSQRNSLRINIIENPEWQRENAVSVLKAKDILNEEKFLLCMSDHIFNESLVKRLLDTDIEDGEISLCVDFRINPPFLPNPTEATKVFVEDGRIKDIGKNIQRYNGYDTGFFLCTPIIFSAIEESIQKNKDETLSGAVKFLAEKGMARAVDAGADSFWIDVDDYEAYKKAESFLIETISKKDTDGPVSKYLNRKLSLRITKYLVNTDITPNKISFFSFLMSLIASFNFFLGKYMYLFLGAILAQISSIIDGCDGEIARLKLQSTKFGAWFDAILDRYSDGFLLFGLTIYAYLSHKSLPVLFTGFMAIIGSFINSYMADKYDQFMIKEFVKANKSVPIRIGRDIRIMIIFVGAILNQVFFTLLLMALLMNLENIRRIVIIYQNQKKVWETG